MIEKNKLYLYRKSQKENLYSRFPADLVKQIIALIPPETEDWFWFKFGGKLDILFIGPHIENPSTKRIREIKKEIATLMYVPLNLSPHDVDYDYYETKVEYKIADLKAELNLLEKSQD